MERLTHDADFGLEDWEEILYSVKSDPYGAYNILDIAECVGENEFDEILKSISLRLRDYEDIGLEPEEISAKIEACNIYKSLGLTPYQIQWLKLRVDNYGWTSVDERLPEDVYTSSELHEKCFLITNSCGEEKLVQRMRCVPAGYVWHDGYDTHRAVAWRYIEPYKPERSVKE